MVERRSSTAPPATPPPAPSPGPSRAAGVTAIGATFVELMRAFTKAKARMLQDAQHDVDRAAHVLLRSLSIEGPMRVSALAASVGSDVSTVSRQVTALVNDGLLERSADPGDSRASLLVPTAAGRAVIVRHEQVRTEFFDAVLSNWTLDDVRQFAGQLARFAADYDQTHTAWISERTGRRSPVSGGTTR